MNPSSPSSQPILASRSPEPAGNPNRTLENARLIITKIAFGGSGIGTLPAGKICFVPYVIPGEVVTARILRDKKSYAEARLETLNEASPQRVIPPCPVFGTCGGCQYQHIAYPHQLTIKRDQVIEVLTRIGGLADPPVEPVIPSPQEYGYRNRISVHSRAGKTGFFERGTRKVVDVAECPIASPGVNTKLAELRKQKPEEGEYALREPSEFYGFRQVNDAAAELLLSVVEDAAKPGGPLLVDAYCGAGFFARRLQSRFQEIVGLEWSADAVRHARRESPAHVRYIQGDVIEHLESAMAAAPSDETTVLFDPPAEGLPQTVIDQIACRPPARIIYVSCDPATLARDLKKLSSTHTLRRVCPVDMFPQTAQIECVAVLAAN